MVPLILPLPFVYSCIYYILQKKLLRSLLSENSGYYLFRFIRSTLDPPPTFVASPSFALSLRRQVGLVTEPRSSLEPVSRISPGPIPRNSSSVATSPTFSPNFRTFLVQGTLKHRLRSSYHLKLRIGLLSSGVRPPSRDQVQKPKSYSNDGFGTNDQGLLLVSPVE